MTSTSSPPVRAVDADRPRGLSAQGQMIACYVVSLALSWPLALLWPLPPGFQPGDVAAARDAYGQVGPLYGLGPALAAVLVAAATGRATALRDLLRRLARWRVHLGWYAAALVLPALPPWIGIAVWRASVGVALDLPPAAQWLARWLQISIIAGLISLGEELGWRGYLLPRVRGRHPWRRAALLVGGGWAVWHYPIWIRFNHAATGSIAQTIALVLVASAGALGASVLLTWLFDRTRGSVPLAMLFHGSANATMYVFYERAPASAATSLGLLLCTTAATVGVAAAVALTSGAAARVPAVPPDASPG